MYKTIKTFTHSQGLSCAFRQWRAQSHCRFIHGYALQIEITFSCKTLDERKWVVDFGGLDYVKRILQDTFDHKTVVAADDPHLDEFQVLHADGICELVVLPDVGCEAFARYVHRMVKEWLPTELTQRFVKVESVMIREHGGNAAVYQED